MQRSVSLIPAGLSLTRIGPADESSPSLSAGRAWVDLPKCCRLGFISCIPNYASLASLNGPLYRGDVRVPFSSVVIASAGLPVRPSPTRKASLLQIPNGARMCRGVELASKTLQFLVLAQHCMTVDLQSGRFLNLTE
ncbi:hypothetical protein [Bradyrhizobium canariense]|uniref:hypothetical protein n=1 Tax=Bradyrhizobium canariense TaxID=255045 RepID=UPI00137477A6|nr:hypothetical protein [Bradyrhizobium canariense]